MTNGVWFVVEQYFPVVEFASVKSASHPVNIFSMWECTPTFTILRRKSFQYSMYLEVQTYTVFVGLTRITTILPLVVATVRFT